MYHEPSSGPSSSASSSQPWKERLSTPAAAGTAFRCHWVQPSHYQYDDSSVCHRKLTFLMKIPWCFLSKMRKHNSKSNKNQRNDPEEINFWWFSNCCLFHLVSIPACRTSRSSLSCYVPHSLGGCIYHLTQRFENLTSLTSRRVVGRVSEIVSPANFDETLKNHHTSILKTFL